MIITGGENVYPIEVEQALALLPDLVESAVIGVPSEKWGEDVLAVVARRPGSPLSEAEIIAQWREKIAHFKCPRRVEFVDALPRNAVGKILKRTLRAPYWAGRERAI